MKNTINRLLENNIDNYILPFFWQHGEDEATLRVYMGVIHNCGIGAVCVESRPHPDFAGPKWWTDLDIIMDEARQRNMKVWVLDDSHFPTGFANGAMKNADASLCKQYLNFNTSDVCGPLPQATLNVGAMAKYTQSIFGGGMFAPQNPRTFDDDALLCVIASKLENGMAVDDTLLDLTELVKDGTLEWNVPAGMWRIFVFYNTRNGGGNAEYINIIDRESCRVLIDAVYEPHFERYKDDFGKTFAGFFSDEPLVGNTLGFSFDESIGRKNMALPWNNDVPRLLAERLGDNWFRLLPALYTDTGGAELTAKVRYAYMDTVTRLVEQNFSRQLGEWCEAHGVEYIGHLIEDNNQHSRLGSSLGHFFRGLAGQHMAGIDDIGGQVLPGGDYHGRNSIFSIGDGEFFHFALGKLGSSHAHIDPKKKGRAMCEIFGAYGWSEGVKMMKHLTDHFIVRGINHFVPHAFSPKEFPDSDCPPHFYAHGHNPLYRHFGHLMGYMNRLCNIFNGGLHIAPAAILYHGEAEWTGGYMYLQKPARELLENQIDFDILPSDLFAEMDTFNASFDGSLRVNGESYRVLVVPYAEFISAAVADFAEKASAHGFEVVFVDALPSGVFDADTDLSDRLKNCTVVPLEKLAAHLDGKGLTDVKLSESFMKLRYYRYSKDGQEAYMFSNEDTGATFDGTVAVPTLGNVYFYDAMDNALRPAEYRQDGSITVISLKLEPYQSIVAVFGDAGQALAAIPKEFDEKTVVSGEWKVSFAKSKDYPNFNGEMTMVKLDNIGKTHPDFSGFIRYENSAVLNDCNSAVLEIDNAFEGVELWVNGENAGMRICPPYRFDISKLVKSGENTLRIEVATTLERAVNAMGGGGGMFSMLTGRAVLAPTGIVGDVAVHTR